MSASNYERSKLANLRDLAGIQTAHGAINPGLSFRSDNLSSIDAQEAQRLQDLGVKLVIDLRTAPELQKNGRGVMEHTQVAFAHIPISEIDDLQDDITAPYIKRELPFTNQVMGYAYYKMLETHANQVVTALEAIANQSGGVLFHCAAGKDRTGLVAASLLTVLGVERSAIIDDFATTNQNLDHLLVRLRQPGIEYPPDGHLRIGALMRADREAMEHFFGILDEQGVTLLDALREAGLTVEVEAKLVAKHH